MGCLLHVATYAQRPKIDSIENVLRHTGSDTNRVLALNQAVSLYWSNNPEKTRQYADEALQLAQHLDYPLGIAKSYVSLGIYYWSQGKHQEAIQQYTNALRYYQQAGSERGRGSVYHNLAMCSHNLGNFSLAMDYLFKSLKISEKAGDREGESNTYNFIGVLFKDQDKYDQALHYYWLAYRKCIIARNRAGILTNIGEIYRLKKDYKKSIAYTTQARNQFVSIKEPVGILVSDNNLGELYLSQRQYDQAETAFQRVIQLGEPLGYNAHTLMAYLGLGDARLQTGQYAQSLTYYEKGRQLSEKQSNKKDRVHAYKGLSTAYAKTGNFTKAYEFQSKWVALKDSTFNEESAKKIARVQAEYQSEKKQAEIELLKKDNEQTALIRNISIVGLLTLSLIGGLVVSRQRLKIRKDQLLVQKSADVAVKNQLLAEQALQLTAANEQLSEQSAQVALSNEQLAQQAVELEQKTQQLQELDQAKSHFFANISHEFRTPLTLILGTLQDKLKSGVTSAQSIQPAEMNVMHRNAKRLLELINQLLDLSKLESGQLKLKPKPGDLAQFFRVMLGSFSSQADYRRIDFNLSMPDTPLCFLFDADKLEKITSNLLSNAFKYTPDGGQIRLLVDMVPNTQSAIRISVQDSGPGIAGDQLDRVFDRFYQGSKQYSDQEGTGIGLALTKELVDLHGGRVWVESQSGEGARFVVQLPLEQCATADVTADDVSIPDPVNSLRITNIVTHDVQPPTEVALTEVAANAVEGSTKPLLLVVEDNADLRMYIRHHLQNQYRVIERENGRLGLEAAQTEMPDLIISDLMMPEMDGLELCEQIKTDERTSHIPVILLTALATQDSKIQGLETGADDYLTKPFDARELLLRVSNLIEMRRRMRERFGREIRLQPKDIVVTSTDEKFLQRIMKAAEENMSDSEFGPEEFSQEVGMSRMQLHRKLTALTGQTTTEFLRTLRLKRAAQLLEAQAGNVSEVAYDVGFANLSYFAKSFREQFGVSASEYIQQLKLTEA